MIVTIKRTYKFVWPINLLFKLQNSPAVSLSEKLDEAVKIRESMKSKSIETNTKFTCEICSKPYDNESEYDFCELYFLATRHHDLIPFYK